MDNNQGKIKSQVISGLFWKFSERMGVQLVNFAISIVLARLLAPGDYGLIALVSIFITISNIFITNGFGNAIIQKSSVDETDLSSVFFFSSATSIILFIVLFFSAPLISDFYNTPALTIIIRVMGIQLIIAGINSVQISYVMRNMMFKRFFFSTLSGTILSAAVSLVMAYGGFGVWALVAQTLVSNFVNMVVLWFTSKWRPKLVFSWQRMKGMYSYSWKLLVSSLVDTTYNELRSLVIGKIYSPADLAYFTKGRQFPNLITTNVNTTIDSVLFPAIAKEQGDPSRVKIMMRRSIKTSAYIMIPLMSGLAVVAKPLVLLLLTDKWSACIPYLQISCFTGVLMPIQTANLQAIKAVGRSDITLKTEIIKKVFGLLLLFTVMRQGVLLIALSGIITASAFSFINAFPNARLLNYKYFEQMVDILPYVLLSAVMCLFVWPVQYLNLSNFLTLAIQVSLGGAVYLLLSWIFKIDSLLYIMDVLKQFLSKQKA